MMMILKYTTKWTAHDVACDIFILRRKIVLAYYSLYFFKYILLKKKNKSEYADGILKSNFLRNDLI